MSVNDFLFKGWEINKFKLNFSNQISNKIFPLFEDYINSQFLYLLEI